jgi:hypothetical protein
MSLCFESFSIYNLLWLSTESFLLLSTQFYIFFASNFCVHLKSQRCFQKFFLNFCFQLKPIILFSTWTLPFLSTKIFTFVVNLILCFYFQLWPLFYCFMLKPSLLLSTKIFTFTFNLLCSNSLLFLSFLFVFSLSTRFPPVCVWVGCQVFWQKLFLIRLLVINSICGFLKLEWFQVKVQMCNSETFNLFLFGI